MNINHEWLSRTVSHCVPCPMSCFVRLFLTQDDVVVAGGWDGRISIISAAHGGMYASFAAHNNR